MGMKNLQENIVPATGQNRESYFVIREGDGPRILFVGNSITKHEPKPEMGWNKDCGMAASAPENDYVHILMNKITETHPNAAFSILQVAEFEWHFESADIEKLFSPAAQFKPDIAVMFFGANVDKAYDNDELRKGDFSKAFEKLRNFIDTGSTGFIISEGFYIRPVLDSEKKSVAEKHGDIFVGISDIREREETHGLFNHPNDLGMKEIADRFFKYIKTFLS